MGNSSFPWRRRPQCDVHRAAPGRLAGELAPQLAVGLSHMLPIAAWPAIISDASSCRLLLAQSTLLPAFHWCRACRVNPSASSLACCSLRLPSQRGLLGALFGRPSSTSSRYSRFAVEQLHARSPIASYRQQRNAVPHAQLSPPALVGFREFFGCLLAASATQGNRRS